MLLYLVVWLNGAVVGAIASTGYLYWCLSTGRRRIKRTDLEQL